MADPAVTDAQVEKAARAICRSRQIDPDRIVYSGPPETIIPGVYAPRSPSGPAWALFTADARAVLESTNG